MKLEIKTDDFDVSMHVMGLSPDVLKRSISEFVTFVLNSDVAARTKKDKPWNLILVDRGEKLIDVIKVIRGITNLPLKEAKDLSERQRTLVSTFESAALAAAAMKQLRDVGATVEIEEAAAA